MKEYGEKRVEKYASSQVSASEVDVLISFIVMVGSRSED